MNKNKYGVPFDESTADAVWKKGRPMPPNDPNVYRKDVCGATMQRSSYGDTNAKYGWEIDHIIPVSRGGSDDLTNLQPLYWENNRSKADNVNTNFCVKTS
jgi:5-methylcytosine-specific restriction endonuclease McrA